MTERDLVRRLILQRDGNANYEYQDGRAYHDRLGAFNAAKDALRKLSAATVADVEREMRVEERVSRVERVTRLCGVIRSAKAGNRNTRWERQELADILADLGHTRMGSKLRGAA